ncbi:Heat shock 70 kDa protein cognate 4 [Entamoeba marina]
MNDEHVFGISIGSHNICIGTFINGDLRTILDTASNVTCSVINFTTNGIKYGKEAIGEGAIELKTMLSLIHELIGKKYVTTSQQEMSKSPFPIINDNGKPTFEINYNGRFKRFFSEEILSMILTSLKDIVLKTTKLAIKYAVVCCPAEYNDDQRQGIKDACLIGEIKVLRLINEPTSAGVAYKLAEESGENREVVIDIGGKHFTCTMLLSDWGIYEIVNDDRSQDICGEHFTHRIMNWLIKVMKLEPISLHPHVIKQLKQISEIAKIELSNKQLTTIQLNGLFEGYEGQIDLTRTQFEFLCEDLFELFVEKIKLLLNTVRWDVDDVKDVVFVGGSSKIPKIMQLIKNLFQKAIIKDQINPQNVIACGATIQANILNTPRPQNDILVECIIPMTLGIKDHNNRMIPILRRNTYTPVMKTFAFTTTTDYQQCVTFQVFEGEYTTASENSYLKEIKLTGIECAKKNIPRIHVTFSWDINDVITVFVEDKWTGKNNSVILFNGSLNNDQKNFHFLEQLKNDETSVDEKALIVYDPTIDESDDISNTCVEVEFVEEIIPFLKREDGSIRNHFNLAIDEVD